MELVDVVEVVEENFLGDEPDTIIPTYTSVKLEATGLRRDAGRAGRRAHRALLPGAYPLTYDGENGTTFSPFDRTITPRGGVFDLTWDAGGEPGN